MSLPQPSSPPAPKPEPQDELSRLKTLFLTTLNHEIRTPLSGVIGMTDLLLETTLDEEQREYAASARQCAEDLLTLLNATLLYAALEAGDVRIEESEFNLRELAEGAVAAHVAKAREKHLRLFATLQTGLPATLVGDGQRIKEVLGYLLDNAIKFTRQGMVELAASYSKDRLCFAVRDTGIGIAPHKREQIFASFRQGDEGLKREFRGAGLGLTLAEKLLRLMGGRLTLESEPGKGSTFTVEIPVHRPQPEANSARNERNRAEVKATAAGQLPGGLPLVLAVEDNPVGQAVIRHALKRCPINLHTAASGREAIAAAAEYHYDLILMDLQMPDLNGIQTTATIRKLPGYATIPVVALTADVSDEVRRECFAQGMQGFLTKPIQASELWAAVRGQLKLAE